MRNIKNLIFGITEELMPNKKLIAILNNWDNIMPDFAPDCFPLKIVKYKEFHQDKVKLYIGAKDPSISMHVSLMEGDIINNIRDYCNKEVIIDKISTKLVY